MFSDAESDVVLLQPTITYITGVDRFIESGYSSTVYSPSEEAMINKVGYNLVDTIPAATVNIRGAFTKPITNSDIVCKVFMSNDSLYLKDSVVYSVNTNNDTARIVYRVQKRNPNYTPKKQLASLSFSRNTVCNQDVSFKYCTCNPLQLFHYLSTLQYQEYNNCFTINIPSIQNSKTQYWFEISSKTDEKWNDIKWKPELHFTNKTGRDTIIYAGVKYNMPDKKIRYSNGKVSIGTWTETFTTNALGGHNSTYGINFPGAMDVDVKCDIQLKRKNNIPINNVSFTHITMDKNGNELSRTGGIITNNMINVNTRFSCTSDSLKSTLIINDTLTNFDIVSLTNGYFPVASTVKKSYLCGSHTEYTGGFYVCIYDEWKTKSGSFDNSNQVDIFCQRTNKEMELGSMYRGWGQFEYNSSTKERFMSPIKVDSLYMPRNMYEMDSLRNLVIYRLMPEPVKKQSWQGMNKQIYIKGDTISLGRLNIETMPDLASFSSSPGGGGEYMPANRLFLVNPTKTPSFLFKESQPLMDENKNPVYTTSSTTGGASTGSTTNTSTEDVYKINTAPVLSSTAESNTSWGGASATIGVSLGASGSTSDGSTITTSAFTDMNGDGYPDYITDDQIEYTNIRGSRDGEKSNIDQETTTNNSWSVGINSCYSSSKSPNSGGDKYDKGSCAQIALDLDKDPTVSVSAGASYSNNSDHATTMYADVNGDGLPDRIYEKEKGVYKVKLNLGFSFSNQELDYNIQSHVQGGSNRGVSLNISGGFDAGYIGAGISKNYSTSTALTLYTLRDINGDGLADQIYFDKKGDCYIAYNYGNRFNCAIKNNQIKFINKTVSLAKGESYNVKVTIPVMVFFKIIGGSSINSGESADYICSDIQDINGDGYPDLLSLENNSAFANFLKISSPNLLSPESNKVIAKLSKIGCTNKLKSVTNSFGGIFTVGYERSNATNAHPGGKWVMSTVLVNDGITDDGTDNKTTYKYDGGKYDRYEREFLGFAVVNSRDINTEDNSVYRCITQKFDTLNCYSKGSLLSTSVNEGDDETGNKYNENTNEYYTYSVSKYVYPKTGKNYGKYSLVAKKLTFDSIVNKQYIIYSPLKYNQSKMYSHANGVADSIVSSQAFYDYYTNAGSHGEIRTTKFSDKGSLKNDGSGVWNYRTETEYLSVYSLPKKHTVYNFNNTILRQLYASWDTLYSSHLTQVKTQISDNEVSIVDMKYDGYGNIFQKTFPANSSNQRMSYTYTYGDRYHQYLTGISDAFGYRKSLGNYNYIYGVPCRTTDINGNVMLTSLDNLGRVSTITGPNEVANNKPYTLKFEYFPKATFSSGKIDKHAYALTKHYDESHPNDDLETITFCDGFGRSIQVNKDASVNGSAASVISGCVKYDAFGRAVKTYFPTIEMNLNNKLVFHPAFNDTIPHTTTTYDVLDRVTCMTQPDGNATSTSYSIDSIYLKTLVTDAVGGSQASFTNGSGLTCKTEQYSGPAGTITTIFDYDAINQPTVVTDTKGERTESFYDLAGRRTKLIHPASGTSLFGYDLAGNLITRQTANLIQSHDTIKYLFEFNRLKSIHYPEHPENDVTYTYGTSADTTMDNGNRAGRLKYLNDGSGIQEFKYGRMGEIIENRRTLVIPNQAVATYVTSWTYDSWNRVRSMTYPDGEALTHSYDLGGQLTALTGLKGGFSYPYVKSITYDRFEQRNYIKYGNDAETRYTYDAKTRNLMGLSVVSTKVEPDRTLMNNAYTYDKVNNVLSVKNLAAIPTTGIGGRMEHDYHYDGLYRLSSASGSYQGNGNKMATYSLSMGYDNLHNITGKNQSLVQKDLQFIGELKTGYDLKYSYQGNKQQISTIADTNYRTTGTIVKTGKAQHFSYDANGNMLCVNTTEPAADGNLRSTNNRRLLWDEENRLLAVSDNGFVSNYWYDASGERTVKMSGQGEGVLVNGILSGGRTVTSNYTAYVNPYLVITNGGQMSKHFYIGSQRVVSKLCSSGSTTSSPLTETKAANALNAYAQIYADKYTDLTSKVKTRFDSLGVSYHGKANAASSFWISNPTAIGTNETDQYYYHPDHLGSSSLITNLGGDLVQHIEYVPFGEVFVEERTSTWGTQYKFNAKELDEETGLYYYVHRYYDPRWSMWLGVDQMSEKFPNFSSYSYCKTNPINRIDPDGNTDRFNSNGIYLGSNFDGIHEIVITDGGKPKPFSSLQTSRLFNMSERNAAEKVIGFYAKIGGINEDIDVNMRIGDYTAYNPLFGDIDFFSTSTGGLSASFNNYFNLLSTLEHEHFHKLEKVSGNYTYSDHARVYLNQITKGKYFKSTTQNYKNNSYLGLIQRLTKAKSSGETQYKGIISEFNANNPEGYKIVDHDSGGMTFQDKNGQSRGFITEDPFGLEIQTPQN